MKNSIPEMMRYSLVYKHFPLSTSLQNNYMFFAFYSVFFGKTESGGERTRQSADKEHVSSAKPLTLINSWTVSFSSQG